MTQEDLILKIRTFLSFLRYKLFKSFRRFAFEGRTYQYVYAWYNKTWTNERAVELPIVSKMVKDNRGRRILEVGNVLSHYFPADHDILDKYERGNGVINQDVVDFRPSQKYDLIVSISTLEHVGWDEKPKEPEKFLAALENLKGLLAPDGTLVATLPLGYNPEMDHQLQANKCHLTHVYYLKRISQDNRWIECESHDVQGVKYDEPFPYANGLVIGLLRNANSRQALGRSTNFRQST